jgi:hypothetical protein
MKMAEHKSKSGPDERERKLVGQAIIDGLLSVGSNGRIIFADASSYNQAKGGYWQGPGGTHTQGEGDYHQADTKAE